MRRVRIEYEGAPAWGELRDGEVVLDSGAALDPATVTWLAPVEPSKILAVHLTYRSRLVDYDARQPAEPSYFLKPPSSLNGHLGVIRRPRGARYLNYEGELAVVVGTRMHGVPSGTCTTTCTASRRPTTSGCTTSATPIAARCCASRDRTASCRSARRS